MKLLNKSRGKVFIIASLACAGTSMLVAVTSVATNRGFGARDLWPFLTWTIAFAAILALIAHTLVHTLAKVPVFARYCLAGAAGIVAGVLWTYAVGQLLGPWVGAFSLPILFCWIGGGASGMIVATLYREKTRRRAALIAIPVILFLSASAWALSRSVGVFGEQQLELLVIKWQPGPKPLTSMEVLGVGISKTDLERLQAIGLTGEVMYAGSSKHGQGRVARAIIVTQGPLSEPVDLPQPDGSELIYVQGERGWRRYPPDARTSQKQIRLWTDFRGSSQNTLFSIERADGSRQTGTAATW